MGTLYVIRHGQASLFTDDYDRLSDLGRRQARTLADAWLNRGLEFDAVWTGDLKRQVDTAKEVAAAFSAAGRPFPEPVRAAGLNEYPADEIMATLGHTLRERDPRIAELFAAAESATDGSERSRHFQRLLEAVIGHWVSGEHAPDEAPVSWRSWSDGVRQSLSEAMSRAEKGAAIAVFTSGGVIGVTVQTVLAAPPIKAAELNWRIYNGSVTRYTFSGQRVSLDHFNDIGHFPRDQLTYR